MIHVLPFVAGLIAGAAAVAALRSERGHALVDESGARLRAACGEAGAGVRAAARSGIDLLRSATARAPTPAKEDAAPGDHVAQAEKATKPARRRAAAGKSGATKARRATAGGAKTEA
jgi:hypothetical protein